MRNGFLVECWNRYEGKHCCRKCYNRLFTNPKYNPQTRLRWSKILGKRQILFKKKSIRLKFNPRTGQCSQCKKKVGDEFVNCYSKVAKMKRTAMHHINYDNDNPLENAIELCASCHAKESWRLGQCWNYKQRAKLV
jgi:hypothetical protein